MLAGGDRWHKALKLTKDTACTDGKHGSEHGVEEAAGDEGFKPVTLHR
jgi:hypothetical protein